MSAAIERIVDRKLIKQRVHYYVVWKGFGEENNTWYTASSSSSPESYVIILVPLCVIEYQC